MHTHAVASCQLLRDHPSGVSKPVRRRHRGKRLFFTFPALPGRLNELFSTHTQKIGKCPKMPVGQVACSGLSTLTFVQRVSQTALPCSLTLLLLFRRSNVTHGLLNKPICRLTRRILNMGPLTTAQCWLWPDCVYLAHIQM